MEPTQIAALTVDKHVLVRGWIEKITNFKKHSFLILRDGVGNDCRVQVFISHSIFNTFVIESYVEMEGVCRKLEGKAYSIKPFELEAISFKVLGCSNSDYPARCPSDATMHVKLNERHLYVRDYDFAVITKLRNILVQSLREYFEETSCTEIYPPSFVGNQCEGGSTLFRIPHYPAKDSGNMQAYLSQSSQFYLEYALPGVGDCFCIAPSFRAERSETRRHLTEFLHVESEWSGIMTLEDHLEKLRDMMQKTVSKFLMKGRKLLDELKLTERVENLLEMTNDIVTVTHKEAIDYCREHHIYKEEEGEVHFDYEDDIPEMQERRMIDEMNKIVFLVKFPKGFKSFYFKTYEDGTVLGCDVEVPGVGEVVGSGVRESNYEGLVQAIKDNGLNVDDYREYLDLRKYGAGHTSGMGLGLDRFLTWLLGKFNIREVVTFPRYPGKLFP